MSALRAVLALQLGAVCVFLVVILALGAPAGSLVALSRALALAALLSLTSVAPTNCLLKGDLGALLRLWLCPHGPAAALTLSQANTDADIASSSSLTSLTQHQQQQQCCTELTQMLMSPFTVSAAAHARAAELDAASPLASRVALLAVVRAAAAGSVLLAWAASVYTILDGETILQVFPVASAGGAVAGAVAGSAVGLVVEAYTRRPGAAATKRSD